MPSPQDKNRPEYRMQLNNHLQAIRGTKRFRWDKPDKSGTDDRPTWSIKAFFDNEEFGHGAGGDLGTAKEEAARQVLMRIAPNLLTSR